LSLVVRQEQARGITEKRIEQRQKEKESMQVQKVKKDKHE
jgi:hypothetical protein